MSTLPTFLKASLVLATITLLVGLAGCEPEAVDPQTGSLVTVTPLSPLPTEVLPSLTPPVSAPPTPDDLGPTLPPSPTPPPVPTLPPTPVVTPIPTAIPPIIPEVVGKTQQPFWIIYWQDNQIWRIDDKGQNRQLLLDTHQRLGRWLTGYPHPGSDCCLDSPRVVVSPDGQKLALVVLDKINVKKDEPYTYSMYVFDLQSGDLKFISNGGLPRWSPDSKRIAFIQGAADPDGFAWEGGLWIADLETDQVYKLIEAASTDTDFLWVSTATWSPDSQRIAYRYSEGRVGKPEIWIKSVTDSSPPFLIPNILPDFYPYDLSWVPDGQRLLGNVPDWAAPGRPINLWVISVNTGERRQLTRDMDTAPVQWSPDREWLVVNGRRLYEREEQPYDLWLLSADSAQLLRVTSGPPQDLGAYWSPDGTRLIFQRDGIGLVILSLATGDVTELGVNLPYDSRYNYAIGGIK